VDKILQMIPSAFEDFRDVSRCCEGTKRQICTTSLYARDGVLVSRAAKAVKTGAQEIEQTYQSVFKSGMNHTDITVDQVSPLGTDAVIAIGEYRGSGYGQNGPIEVDGHWTGVDVREGGIWKVRLLTAFPNPPPAATGSAATPSGPMR
jgi:ketosteroid isomerase-like protein